MEEKFIQFLKNENVYHRFKGYFAASNPNKDLKDYLNNTHPIEYLTSAFDWSFTDEPEDFWYMVHYKWKRFVNEEYDYTITFSGKEIDVMLLHQDIKRLLRNKKYDIDETNVKISCNKTKQ